MKGRWNHQWLARKDHNFCGDLQKTKLGEVQNGWQTFLWRFGFEVTIWKPKGGRIHYRKMLIPVGYIKCCWSIPTYWCLHPTYVDQNPSINHMCFFKRYYSRATHRCLNLVQPPVWLVATSCNTICLNKSQVDNVSPNKQNDFYSLKSSYFLVKSPWFSPQWSSRHHVDPRAATLCHGRRCTRWAAARGYRGMGGGGVLVARPSPAIGAAIPDRSGFIPNWLVVGG